MAATLRERDYLRRQVQVLSAEGQMSAWILGALPLVSRLYMVVVNPTYLEPMLTTPLGWLMLGGGRRAHDRRRVLDERVVKVDV